MGARTHFTVKSSLGIRVRVMVMVRMKGKGWGGGLTNNERRDEVLRKQRGRKKQKRYEVKIEIHKPRHEKEAWVNQGRQSPHPNQ